MLEPSVVEDVGRGVVTVVVCAQAGRMLVVRLRRPTRAVLKARDKGMVVGFVVVRLYGTATAQCSDEEEL